MSAPAVVFIRTDTADPVITLQSETDVFQLNSVASRQSDSLNFRIWEVSGSSHSDLYTTLKAPLDTGVTPRNSRYNFRGRSSPAVHNL